VFGDVDVERGDILATQILTTHVTFVEVDVRSYEDNLKLFDVAHRKYGRVDHAIACAGILESGDWFGSGLTIEDVKEDESSATMDVNLLGTTYFARIALPYLRDGKTADTDKSLTLISSVVGFGVSSAMPIYQVNEISILCFAAWPDFSNRCLVNHSVPNMV
jgi:NAD(P)-dependent dehydrogenase (short-subunit alcohol dehydrogenase family)